MNIGTGWIDPQFYSEGTPDTELLAQLSLTDDLRGALF
jgi:hypothetical protein